VGSKYFENIALKDLQVMTFGCGGMPSQKTNAQQEWL
jgi:hypothetical protein